MPGRNHAGIEPETALFYRTCIDELKLTVNAPAIC